ncbi:hypothetical protein KR51_00009660 [Rubidibacter lacunae KORDI 51-2]|uniref:Uncharacterized protein n=1 Tax=Rubidibacter lacunae KORDI 51-2 TaxID=582515 RepID=U5DP18_9CHRO|nr:hypothetical protein [Rubidibacter lacunae]ERN42354.1 hypothetical protein KR51_00009660 [Rubidibacter lacunae KORDI 51-2]
MTGFIRRLFGSKPKDNAQPPQQFVQRGEYFLDPNEAKTYGNYEYMKKSFAIRHTFPKTKSREALETVVEVSSDKMVKRNLSGGSQAAAKPESKLDSRPISQPAPRRRSSDTGMDIFRNMARDIKK